jgi:hypothetical protein
LSKERLIVVEARRDGWSLDGARDAITNRSRDSSRGRGVEGLGERLRLADDSRAEPTSAVRAVATLSSRAARVVQSEMPTRRPRSRST